MATEKRLIDGNALLEHFKFRISPESLASHSVYLQTISDCVSIARKIIEEAPTVDAVEVVHGRWKYYHKQNIAVCTNCSFERDLDANFGRAISCPNCGAKMDGRE